MDSTKRGLTLGSVASVNPERCAPQSFVAARVRQQAEIKTPALERCLSRTSIETLSTQGQEGEPRPHVWRGTLPATVGAASLCGSSCLGTSHAGAGEVSDAKTLGHDGSIPKAVQHRRTTRAEDECFEPLPRAESLRRAAPSLRRFVQHLRIMDRTAEELLRQLDRARPENWSLSAAVGNFTSETGLQSKWGWRTELVSWLMDLCVTLGMEPGVGEFAFFMIQKVFMIDTTGLCTLIIADATGERDLKDESESTQLARRRRLLDVLHLVGAAATRLAAARSLMKTKALGDALGEVFSIERSQLESAEAFLLERFQWPRKYVGLDAYIFRICEWIRRVLDEHRFHVLHHSCRCLAPVWSEDESSLLETCLFLLEACRPVILRIYLSTERAMSPSAAAAAAAEAEAAQMELEGRLPDMHGSPATWLASGKVTAAHRVDIRELVGTNAARRDARERPYAAMHPRYFCAALLIFLSDLLQNTDHGSTEIPLELRATEQDSCSVEQEHGSQGADELLLGTQPGLWSDPDETTENRVPCAALNVLLGALMPTDTWGQSLVSGWLTVLQESDLRTVLEALHVDAPAHSPNGVRPLEQTSPLGAPDNVTRTSHDGHETRRRLRTVSDKNVDSAREKYLETDEWLWRRFSHESEGTGVASQRSRLLHIPNGRLERMERASTHSSTLLAMLPPSLELDEFSSAVAGIRVFSSASLRQRRGRRSRSL